MDTEVESKIRVTLPEYIYNMILNDEKDFEINKNKLCNYIFEIYGEKIDFDEPYTKTKYNKLLQFNLTNDNKDIYADIASRYKIDNKAEYFRKTFFSYCDQPKYKRELMIFEKSVSLINLAIKKGKKLKIKYKEEYRIIEPYFLINSDGETRNYISCYCDKNKEYRNYRLVNIKAISVMKEENEQFNDEYIREIKENFDAFLSYGNKIKVKMNEEGQKHFQKVIANRPKLLEQNGDVFTFECSDLKAKLYFTQFLENAEIIEPENLRKWFIEKFERVIQNYKKGV